MTFKIKGWEKSGRLTNKKGVWKNPEIHEVVFIMRYSPSKSLDERGGFVDDKGERKIFDTKEGALKEAKRYMENNQ
jgi:hypothetical protein